MYTHTHIHTRALQVIHDVAIQKIAVRFILDRAGLVGNDGPTHHGSFDLAYLGCIPGLAILAPSDEVELKHRSMYPPSPPSSPGPPFRLLWARLIAAALGPLALPRGRGRATGRRVTA